MATLLTSPFFIGYVLPFVLIFTVMFAILQKSKVLGDGKKQIDAIVSLVVGLIVISFANAVGIINSLLPFMAVAIVIILVFLLLTSMLYLKPDGDFQLGGAVKKVIGGLVAIALVIAVMVVTGAWDYILNKWFGGPNGGEGLANFIFVVAVLIAVGFVVWPKSKSDGK